MTAKAEAEAAVSCPLIAVGANRHPAAADWSRSGLLAFGAGRCIALWSPLDRISRGVHATLKGHADRVNAVRFLPPQSGPRGSDSPDSPDILVSGSVDQSVRVWVQTRAPGSPPAAAAPAAGLFTQVWSNAESARKGSVNAIAACAGAPDIFASASADGTVAVYRISTSSSAGIEVAHLQSFSTAPKFYPLSLALSALPHSQALILAVAGSSSSIAIYVSPAPGAPFAPQATLSGHENWIRALSFTPEGPASGDLILASASQDKYIRLWRIHAGAQLPPATASDETKTYGLSTRLSNKAHKLHSDGGAAVWSVTFEALLMGHDDWIYTASWRPSSGSGSGGKGLQLLSASADSSLSIWAPEPQSGIWLTTSRLGEISDTKGASTATGSVGGLWTGLWAPDGNTVAAVGKTGSWRIWSYSATEDRWVQTVGISGHVKDATGCAWGADGAYLLSTGLDQTTRLYARWAETGSWHEFARPQIHGYDINCVASVGGSRFVSGADEKLVRVFDEPRGVAGMLERLCGIHEAEMSTMPETANVPVLGLSNKATTDAPLPLPPSHPDDDPDLDLDPASPSPTTTTTTPATSILTTLPHPPLEAHLSRHTLWPEREKLYGHGYEISCLTSTPHLLATAAKASTAEHAVIRLFSTHTWRELKPALAAHTLTVTALRFSPDGGRRLLSVGRDRAWALFERDGDGAGAGGEDGDAAWGLVERREKAHSRMLLGAAWAPGELDGGEVFVTAGRDRCVKVWRKQPDTARWECGAVVKCEMPVTAVDFLPYVVAGGRAWLAVGEEGGALGVYSIGGWDEEVWEVCRFSESITPDKAVTGISWSPREGVKEMAVTSEDGSVRVYILGTQEGVVEGVV